jgi:uncharacterized protein
MTRDDAIVALKQRADAVKGMGATALYLFGSTVRNEATAASDLDVFIDYDPVSRFNAFDLVGIKLMLEKELQLSVDVTTRDGLHPRLKERIEQSAIQVF